MSLAAPLFLLALGLIALPWWLHRREVRNPPELEWSSLMLLRPGETPSATRERLTDLVLLALRCLAIGAAAVAFAEPLIARDSPAAHATPSLHAIVVDASLSMQRPGIWEEALASASDVLDSIPADEPAMIVRAGTSLDATTDATTDIALLRSALAGLTPTAERTELGELVRRTEALAAVAAPDLPLDVHVISDFQQSAFPTQLNALLGERARVTLHPVRGAAPATNLVVERIDVRRTAQGSFVVQARVQSFGPPPSDAEIVIQGADRDAVHVPVRFTDSGIAEVRVDVDAPGPGASFQPVRMQVRLTAGDALPADDVRWAVANPPIERVLPAVVGVAAGADVTYLAAAVGAFNDHDFVLQPLTPADAETRDLDEVSLIILSDPGPLPELVATRLDRWLRAGGAALIVLGERTLAAGQVPLTAEPVAALPAGPGRVLEVSDGHAALAERDAWRDVFVHRAVRLTDARPGTVLMRLDDGTPLLYERRWGGGTLLVLTTALHRDWNDLLVRPLFVRFLGGVLRYLSPDHIPDTASVGDVLELPPGAMQLYAPDGTRVLTLDDRRERTAPTLWQPGFYEAVRRGREHVVAVNPDVRESDLTPADAAWLTRWQAPSTTPKNDTAQNVAPRTAANGIETPATTTSLAPALLMALALVLVAEALVANFGRLRPQSLQRLGGRRRTVSGTRTHVAPMAVSRVR